MDRRAGSLESVYVKLGIEQRRTRLLARQLIPDGGESFRLSRQIYCQILVFLLRRSD
jgi:hypothetical protein